MQRNNKDTGKISPKALCVHPPRKLSILTPSLVLRTGDYKLRVRYYKLRLWLQLVNKKVRGLWQRLAIFIVGKVEMQG